MSNNRMESTTQFIKRHILNAGSNIYRSLVFPFVRMRIERKCDSILGKGVYLMGGSTLAGHNYVGDHTVLNNVHLGYGSTLSRDSVITNTRIGKYSSFGTIQTYLGLHPAHGENISIHPAFYSSAAQFGFTYVSETSFNEAKFTDESCGIQIDIGNDVWIGAGTIILEGTHIGDGAIIGAGSLVNKDIEPYAIYAGVPAKKIGSRFNEETISKLLNLKWWDKDEEWIKSHAASFKNPGEFISSTLK